MPRPPLSELAVFEAVARFASFSRAATFLDVSPSTVSHTIRGLEERIGVRLLARTTRSVDLTEPGQRLIASLKPALAQIDDALEAVSEWRDRPAGTVRLTTFRYFADTILEPHLPAFIRDHPDISVEIVVNDRFSDLVTDGLDAGIRFGGHVPKDMVALRIGPDVDVMVVASPGYLAARGTPTTPRDLLQHNCIGYRLHGGGAKFAWPFEKGGETIQVTPAGSLTLNLGTLARAAVRQGVGIGYFLAEDVREEVASGRLVRVLADWHQPMPGPHIYHLSRRQTPPALRCLIDHLHATRQ